MLFVVVLPLVLSGCDMSCSDNLTVFEDHLLTETEIRPLLHEYRLASQLGGADAANKPKATLDVSLRKRGIRYYVDIKVTEDGRSVHSGAYVLFCHIPKLDMSGTTQDTILITSPRLSHLKEKGAGDASTANVFALIRTDGDLLYMWFIADSSAVARGKIKKHGDVFKVDEVKKFLAGNADAYTLANDPYMFRRK